MHYPGILYVRSVSLFNLFFARSVIPVYYLGEVYFSIASFLMSFAGNIITASLTLAAVSRYLSARRPQGQFVATLLKMDNINYILWPVLFVYTLPEVFMMNVRESEGDLLIQMDNWELLGSVIDGVLHLSAVITYYVYVRRLAWMLNLEKVEQLSALTDPHLLLQGNSRIVGCVRVYLCIATSLFLGMVGLFFLGVHWLELIGYFVLICEVLWLLLCPAESICFGLLNKTFRTECSVYPRRVFKDCTPSKSAEANMGNPVVVTMA
ncbi:hypothetical protein BIW11_05158 [Tropilaelaps mercedesae]|uniref:Uncharacterized protein n=1 Tax=Tropilaelaps mercedesae TaxID=418985 RepID=A0A1V9Y3G3_9ACAR|nr:hypothetical protein BIW11_05158 [Tropilaelaps mercedesae]